MSPKHVRVYRFFLVRICGSSGFGLPPIAPTVGLHGPLWRTNAFDKDKEATIVTNIYQIMHTVPRRNYY